MIRAGKPALFSYFGVDLKNELYYNQLKLKNVRVIKRSYKASGEMVKAPIKNLIIDAQEGFIEASR